MQGVDHADLGVRSAPSDNEREHWHGVDLLVRHFVETVHVRSQRGTEREGSMDIRSGSNDHRVDDFFRKRVDASRNDANFERNSPCR